MHCIVIEFAKDPRIVFPDSFALGGKFEVILDGRINCKVVHSSLCFHQCNLMISGAVFIEERSNRAIQVHFSTDSY